MGPRYRSSRGVEEGQGRGRGGGGGREREAVIRGELGQLPHLTLTYIVPELLSSTSTAEKLPSDFAVSLSGDRCQLPNRSV